MELRPSVELHQMLNKDRCFEECLSDETSIPILIMGKIKKIFCHAVALIKPKRLHKVALFLEGNYIYGFSVQTHYTQVIISVIPIRKRELFA